jgi:hypothetical protein
MPLQPQEVEIPLTLGMATKPNDELQAPTSMRLVQNLHWREQGGIERRPAYNTPATISGPSASRYDGASSCGLVARGDDAVLVSGSHGVATVDESTQELTWAYRNLSTGAIPSGDGPLKFAPVSYDVTRRFVERTQGSKDEYGVVQVAAAQYNGIQVIAWTTHSGSTKYLYCKAIDPETGRVIATSQRAILAAATDHISACEYTESGNEGVLIAYASANSLAPFTIQCIRYDAASNTFENESSLTADASGSGGVMRFLVKKNGNRFYLAYRSNSTGGLVVADRTLSGTTSSHSASHDFFTGLDIVVGPTRTLIVSTLLGDLYAEVFGSPGSYITLDTSATDTYFGCTAALETQNDGSTHDAVVWVNAVSGASGEPNSTYVKSCEVNFSNTAPSTTSTEKVVPHAWCVSRAFTLQGRAHVAMALGFYQAATTTTTAGVSCIVARYASENGVVRHDPVAKICHDRFFVRADEDNLDIFSSTYVDTNDNAWIALPADAASATVDFGGVDVYYPRSIFLSRVCAQRPMPVPYAAPEPGVVCVAGGFPWQFDGDTPAELAPVMFPVVSLDVSSGTGETGTFSVIGMWKWIDAAGRLHRVASLPVSTGAITNKQIDVYVSQPPFTAYDGTSTTEVSVEVYITNGSTDVYQLAMTSSTGGKQHYTSKTSNGLWYKFSDVDPGFGQSITESIFTTELAPEPIPAFLHISKIADRMWAVDAEDRGRVWFSKPLVAGFAAEWCVANTLAIGDEATAVIDVGGFPTVLARGGIYQIAGAGPDATGAGSFAPAQKMPYEVDCVDPVSVCQTPMGVVFRGRRGLYLMGNGINDAPGLLIDSEMLTDPTSDPSSSATYRLRVVYQEQTSEVHCITPGNDRLVYNLFEQKWSKYTDTSVDALDLSVARGRLHALRTNGSTETVTSEKLFSIDGSSYNSDSTGSWSIETPWYKPDQIGGQLRLWRVFAMLRAFTDPEDCTLTITMYFDWDFELSQSVTWSGSDLQALAQDDSTFTVQVMPAYQAIRSVKAVITCTATAATKTLNPLALRLQFGTRPSKGKRNPGIKG